MTWHVGDIWKPTATVTDPKTKGKVEADAIVCEVIKPSGKQAAVSVLNPSLGEYEAAIPLTEPGWWRVIFKSATGEYQGVETAHIPVLAVPTSAG